MIASEKASLQPDSGGQWQVPDGAWNYELYRSLPEDGRYEIHNGRLVISPLLDTEHQSVLLNLVFFLRSWSWQERTNLPQGAPRRDQDP